MRWGGGEACISNAIMAANARPLSMLLQLTAESQHPQIRQVHQAWRQSFHTSGIDIAICNR